MSRLVRFRASGVGFLARQRAFRVLGGLWLGGVFGQGSWDVRIHCLGCLGATWRTPAPNTKAKSFGLLVGLALSSSS